MRYPLTLSASGNFAEGYVDVPGLASTTDLILPPGKRQAPLIGLGRERLGPEEIAAGRHQRASDLEATIRTATFERKQAELSLKAMGR